VTRPSLAQHAERLARLEKGAEHDAEHDAAVLSALGEIRDEMKALREHVGKEVESLNAKHGALDTAVKEAKAMVRGFGAGWAAAFMFIGGAIGAGLSNLTGLFK
jgi:hypothetical protein